METTPLQIGDSWQATGFGVWVGPVLPRINHAVWADNIWLFASTWAHLETMTQELTTAIYGAGLAWKLSPNSSLKTMAGLGQEAGAGNGRLAGH